MQFLDLTLPTPEENLALDEALLTLAEQTDGSEVLRLWEVTRPCVVMGCFCRIATDVNEAACAADGVPVRRRVSGGGTVLIGPGCLNFSLVLDMRRRPELNDVSRSHFLILDRITEVLTARAEHVGFDGSSDLCLAGKKFSGNAQRRRRNWLLHHGTLLYHFPLDLIGRYLREPERQPAYRDQRSHADFVTNLPTDARWLDQGLRMAWAADDPLPAWPRDLTEQLVQSRYSRPEWIRRR
jgi:lipoate---protein ligase